MKKIISSLVLLLGAVFIYISVTPEAYAFSGTVTITNGSTNESIISVSEGYLELSATADDNYAIYVNGNPIQHTASGGISEGGYKIVINNLKVTVKENFNGTVLGEFTDGLLHLSVDVPYQIHHNDEQYFHDSSEYITQAGYLLELSPVFDDHRPIISDVENFATNVSDARPLDFFLSYISAYDETDGDLTSSIYVIKDDYTNNLSTLGKYAVEIGVKDSSGNVATAVFYINVVDITGPVITGNESLDEISYTKTFDIQSFKESLSVSDKYYNLTNSV